LPASKIESACAEIDVAQLQDILKKYTAAEDMFTQPYLHGTTQNIKLLVDMGKAAETPEAAHDMLNSICEREPLYFRCLVEAFKTLCRKTAPAPGPSEVLPEISAVLITDLKEQLNPP
jgi:hypothetical protein